jgi:hypothetical protein
VSSGKEAGRLSASAPPRTGSLCPHWQSLSALAVSVEGCTDRGPQTAGEPPYSSRMDNRDEVREFLMSRRAKVTPEQAEIPAGPKRRVQGLRRTEVAMLAGVSVEYYSKLERGAVGGASASVLDAVSRALRLNDTERAHAGTARTPRRRRCRRRSH